MLQTHLARCFAVAGSIALPPVPVAAQVPATDIHLCTVAADSLSLGPCIAITDRDGYDNQPSFEPDGDAVLYTSMRPHPTETDATQTDIYRYGIATGTTRRVTTTAESEYSPTPRGEQGAFSVVRVEADGTQRLWQFADDGSAPRLLLPGLAPVGYHAWLDANTVALFILAEPHELHLADLATGRGRRIACGIGRSLHRIPGEPAISYIDRSGDDAWWIRRLTAVDDETSGAATPIAPTLPGREDLAWLPSGQLLMADATGLHRYDPADPSATWVLVADLAARGLQDVTRLAVSPRGDRLALVAARPGAP